MQTLKSILQKLHQELLSRKFYSFLPVSSFILFLLGMIFFCLGIAGFFSSSQVRAQEPKDSKESKEPKTFSLPSFTQADPEEITVDISGAVESPAVYTLKTGSRMNELVLLAGGFDEKVDKHFVATQVNLAKKLTDEEKIYIPFAGEVKAKSIPGSSNSSNSSTTSTSSLVSINKATQSELESLEGIGGVKAQQIIESRPFDSLEALVEKKVISQNLFEKIKSRLSL